MTTYVAHNLDALVSMSPQAHVWLAQSLDHCVQLEVQEKQTFSSLLRLDQSISLLSLCKIAESKCNEMLY